jgi:hypothetical protein
MVKPTPGQVVAAAATLGLALLIWHEWQASKHPDESWLDPEQPAAQYDAPPDQVPLRIRQRRYPACLADWSGSKVGDC